MIESKRGARAFVPKFNVPYYCKGDKFYDTKFHFSNYILEFFFAVVASYSGIWWAE
jgi:hypothetical protein